jgi:polysaccharide pyruvyl transferase WcaK-like protein
LHKFDKILVIGNYGNFNIGDEILLKEIIRQNSIGTDANRPLFLIPTRNPFFVDIYHKDLKEIIRAIPINNLLKLLIAFLKCSRIIIGGGGIWSKYTGRYAHMIPLIAILSRVIHKRVDIVSVGIYSTSSSIDKFLVNLAVLASNSCSVRDDESFSMLWKLCQQKTNIVEDLSLSYIRHFDKDDKYIDDLPKVSEYDDIMKHKRRGNFVVGISLKPLHNKNLTLKIIDEFSNAMNILNREYGDSIFFVFFPFAKTDSKIEDDASMINELLEKVSAKDNIVQISHSDPLSWFVAISRLVDIFIGMRYHSIIFATEARKPVLCIPYENKIYQFLSKKNKSLPETSIMEPTHTSEVTIINFVKKIGSL